MPAKKNPLKLNALQLKTLTILQQLARFPETSTHDEASGEALISNLPSPHGNHFHCGDAVVMSADATGLKNEAVWKALERKGLARSMFPMAVALSADGQSYDTGLADKILHRSDH
ncbi:MAG: hypothetical protein HOI96_08675 [Rhodospirillaceae bacterium]|jgi:hypothetical protein|nr:hypothetical protein [Rhodospirillaceae bacterium]MBT6285239.1 hypothetical protein [Rhodospirillaceae bacterium]